MDQDAAWKRLLGRPVAVRHLLRGFVPAVADLLDPDTLRPLPASWVAPDGEQRHGDVAWRASYADGSGRSLVLLIEHQSTVDHDMAVRVLRYETFAFDALRRQRGLDGDGELRMLSVVIHSGTDAWTAAGGTGTVAVEGDGESVRALRPYLFLDTRRDAQDDLARDNIVAAALWLSGASSPTDAATRLQALVRGWSARGDAEGRALSRGPSPPHVEAVLEWLGMLWPRLFPNTDADALATWRRALLNEETGMKNTLAERVREWEADLLERGLEQGIERQRALLCRQAERKFDPETAQELAAHIARVTDAERLAAVGDRIIDCETGTALLDSLGGL